MLRQGAASGVRTSARTYKELRDNLGEGLRFYMGLQVGFLWDYRRFWHEVCLVGEGLQVPMGLQV